MVDYREILRLDKENYSQRQIEASTGISRHTVSDVLAAAKAAGIEWPLGEEVTNEDLRSILFPGKFLSQSEYLEPDYAMIHKELAKPGVTLTLLWNEYCRHCAEVGKRPYMSTQFGDKYRKWAKVTKATMRIQHKPGDVLQGPACLFRRGGIGGMTAAGAQHQENRKPDRQPEKPFLHHTHPFTE